MVRDIKAVMMVMPLFLLVLLGAAAVSAQPLGIGSPQIQQSQHGVLSSANGRFVFGQVSTSSKDQFMLDTATGRLWRIAESGKIGIYLKSVPYRSEKGECSELPGMIPDTAPKKPKKE